MLFVTVFQIVYYIIVTLCRCAKATNTRRHFQSMLTIKFNYIFHWFFMLRILWILLEIQQFSCNYRKQYNSLKKKTIFICCIKNITMRSHSYVCLLLKDNKHIWYFGFIKIITGVVSFCILFEPTMKSKKIQGYINEDCKFIAFLLQIILINAFLS